MKKSEFKLRALNYINNIIDGWFPNDTFNDSIVNGIAKTAIKANQNKFDDMLDVITDDKGELLIEDLLKNIGSNFIGDNGVKMDLREFARPFLGNYVAMLPNKILIYTKEDFNDLVNIMRG